MPETTASPDIAGTERAEPALGTGTREDATVDEVLLTSTIGRVRLLTLNRPRQANAFSSALYLACADALLAAARDDGVGAVVLTGAGRTFCAGTDLVEMAAQATATAQASPSAQVPATAQASATAGASSSAQAAATAQAANSAGQGVAPGADGVGAGPFNVFMDALSTFPKPLLAAVNGAGVGLGLTMLAHCDIVFIAENARLLAPFTTMGVAPEAGSSYLLPRRMGRQRAARALLASEWISAAEAVTAGLALAACPAETLLAETLALATTIADRPLASVLATTRLIRAAERTGVEQARLAENAAFAQLLRRPDVGDDLLRRLDPASRGDEPADSAR